MYKIENLTKKYDGNVIIDNLTLNIKKNKINSIIGRSGIGKTTLLNILSGLDKEYSGDISDFQGKKISFIFQDDRLIDYLSVFDNLKLVLDDEKNAYDIITTALEKCGIKEYSNYYPTKLSGGMRQRINILRAFIVKSEIMLLDEPFKSIDLKLKEDIKKFFVSLHNETRNTCILVEHDIDTVIDISDNINLMSDDKFKLKKHFDDLSDKKRIAQIIREDI
ncbi:hypothetical protein HMPREF9628_01426 [Peptoanaerobacter stomatis]|jgi:ABC transporter related protein|uniref:ABC transporter domain-containing protein n=1 Tax=Peptoanaerobacter stomatis TaxID=796937 RepID=G9XBQ9_9FIRM|nr:ATP-binding cassette domain-containing protein [Peptoanaerobacter stomatis]EHL19614.1 hypothetical protein HMPREF9628_01426 [Peptoanaerobacter stomatis]